MSRAGVIAVNPLQQSRIEVVNLASVPESYVVPFVPLDLGSGKERGHPVLVPWFFAMMLPAGSLISLEGFWFQASVSGIVAERCTMPHLKGEGAAAILKMLPEPPGSCTRCKARLTGMIAWGFDDDYRFECRTCGIERRGSAHRQGRSERSAMPTDVPLVLTCPLCRRRVSRREVPGHVLQECRPQLC